MQDGRQSRMLAILAYHKIGEPSRGAWRNWYYVPEDIFVSHLDCLRAHGWVAVNAEAFLRGLSEPESLPRRSVLVTFDDGFQCIRTVALPLLRKRGLPAVLFVPTDYVGGHNGFDHGCEPEERICTWEDLAALQGSGVSIQSHGTSHRGLSELSPAEMEHELSQSKSMLERNLSESVQIFSFPYGDNGACPEVAEAALRRSGYSAACLFQTGFVRLPAENPFRLLRFRMGAETDLNAALSQAECFLAYKPLATASTRTSPETAGQ